MFRKILITSVMGMLLIGAALTGTSFPVLLLMACLLLIALTETSTREERDEHQE
ncbi:MAG TPA: hypothetical protein VFR47_11970 [Anaerolineales bacterium]|nr:hypothetical protein [Anaerolineales bacterium]